MATCSSMSARKPDGEIEPDQVARLKEMGAWLAKNGEAIYGTRGGPIIRRKPTPPPAPGDAIYISALRLTDGS